MPAPTWSRPPSACSAVSPGERTFCDPYAKVLKDAGYKAGQAPDANVVKAMEKANASLETSEFDKANANVDAWFEKECKS